MNIVITGTSKGIGKQLAEHYLAQGHRVAGCARGESTIDDANYLHVKCDLTNEAEIQAFAKRVRKALGVVDVLINNAGAASMNHFLLTPSETAERLMKINYMSAFHMIRALCGAMRKSEHARIVNFSTVAVPLHLEGEMAYGASKAAVEAMTKVLAKELASMGITVNAIGPAPTPTNLIAKVPEEKLQKLLDAQAIKRYARFEDITNVIDFYIRPESDFITGQIIYLGGIMK